VANALWACARLGYRDAGVIGLLLDGAATRAGEMNDQQLANVLYAAATLPGMQV